MTPTSAPSRRRTATLALALAFTALTAASRAYGMQAPEAGGQRRFALVIGNDTGGDDTRPLLFASEDARKLHAVLIEIGKVAAEDAVLLVNRKADDLRRSLEAIERRAAEARQRGERAVLLFYFSGHAKDGELRLGESRLPLAEIKQRLAHFAADLRIGILDSCRSGAVTRAKGVRRVPAFDIQTSPVDAARGLVLLTSSTSDEDSQ